MNHEERITKIIKLDLKLQCHGQVYVIIAMHINLLKKTITVTNTAARGQPNSGANKDVIFTNYEKNKQNKQYAST